MKEFIIKENRLSEKERRNLSILDSIRRGVEISRAEISKLTDLNIVTVSNYVSKYIKSRVVFETGLDISSGGRRPELLKLNPKYGYSVGIDLGPPHIKSDSLIVAVLTDITGRILARETVRKEKESFEKMIEKVLTLVDNLIIKAGVPNQEIKGIGIGIWGVIDRYRGLVRYAVEKEEIVSYTNLLEKLETKYNVPAVIEHDAMLAAFGERWSGIGVGSTAENLIFLCSDSSCGIIIKGELYFGATKCAGELNLNPPSPTEKSGNDLCWSNYNQGCCLRSRGIDLGISERVKDHLNKNPQEKSLIREITKNDLEKIDITTISKAAEVGDELAIRFLREAGDYLGVKAAFLINLFNPEVLIIGRGIEKAWEVIFPSIRNSVKKWGYDESVKVAKILPTSLGEDAVAIGAAAVVVQDIFANV